MPGAQGPKTVKGTQSDPNYVLHAGATWRIRLNDHGGDAALRQITLTACCLSYVSGTNTISKIRYRPPPME